MAVDMDKLNVFVGRFVGDGHHVSDSILQRDKAIKTIRKWWVESHTATQRGVPSPG